MKPRPFFLRTLASFFGYAVTQISVQATLPTIDLITSFIIPEPGVTTFAIGINSDGKIVGRSEFPGGQLEAQGFLRLRNGDYSVIIDPNQTGPFTSPSAINDSGMVAGYYTSGGSFKGFFLADETYTDFVLPGACASKITGLNNAGDFAGWRYFRGVLGCNDIESFISVGGNVTIFTIPGAEDTTAMGMNNLGQVVGGYFKDATRGFLRDADGTLTFPIDYPGATSTRFNGINDKGWMVGSYSDAEGIVHGLFFQLPNRFVVFDVGESPLTELDGINNQGIICGYYYDESGVANGLVARVHRSSVD
jgi:uncharacterized membrane protein